MAMVGLPTAITPASTAAAVMDETPASTVEKVQDRPVLDNPQVRVPVGTGDKSSEQGAHSSATSSSGKRKKTKDKEPFLPSAKHKIEYKASQFAPNNSSAIPDIVAEVIMQSFAAAKDKKVTQETNVVGAYNAREPNWAAEDASPDEAAPAI